MVIASIRAFWGRLRSAVYDFIIVAMTSIWYREVLTRLPVGCRLLDVGIGTATSLINNRDVVLAKNMSVVGVDYDQGYIDAAVLAAGAYPQLEKRLSLVCASIHDYTGGPFDAIYFSGSFMIIPNKVSALKRCHGMLAKAETNLIYFTQTFEHPGFMGRFMEKFKPWLATLTTIDFGTVTYEKDFRRCVAEAGLVVKEKHAIARGMFRDQVLMIVASS